MMDLLDRRPLVENLEDALDSGMIFSLKRHMPSGQWDETSFYTVKFRDGTTRNFYEAHDITRFIECLLDFMYGKEID